MNPIFRRPIIRIAVLIGAWCCGFLFYMIFGCSVSQCWTSWTPVDWVLSTLKQNAVFLQERLAGMNSDKGMYGQVLALTLGNRDFLTPDIKQLYKEAGAAHLLALSGMHLGILYGTFQILIRNLIYTKWKWVAFAITASVLWFYAIMTGCPKSLMRATLMASVALLVQIDGQRRQAIDILNVSAAIIILTDPVSICDISFQLSCAAMLGIIILGIPFTEVLRRVPFIPKVLLDCLTISIAAQLATLPLTLYYFRSVATYSALTSLLAIPLTTLIIYFSIGIYAGWMWCVPIVEALVRCQNLAMEFVRNLPGAYIEL